MKMSYCSPLQLQESSLMFDCESPMKKSETHNPSSDPGYASASSSLSPTSSVDSFCFSPSSLHQALGNEQDALSSFFFCCSEEPPPAQQTLRSSRSTSAPAVPLKKSRSRYPGDKRQTASEREKLRMRDLTRALKHLRTYLPPSVAPPGQNLTKIETLHLTIRYISYLSEQLGLSEEVLQQRRSFGYVEKVQTLNQFLGHQPSGSYSSQELRDDSVNAEQHSYQVPSGCYLSRDPSWLLQEQPEPVIFRGQC
ncbi:mesoderm posterior protein 2-like [Nothobranchius furzeri]|uniref:Mesoderm posterior protein 2-like n=1 Tax=Nothobranchius furzeri TaxID=105023 RepID=A0A9D3BK65_NOTFU|nr:mesoderm posterior protein 2-like [Nothobranchius furzeri]